jgi:hypothetical protein
MMEADAILAAALDAGAIDEPIFVGGEHRQLLAVDRSGGVAAAFFFDVDENGAWFSDGQLFRRTSPKHWEFLTSRGTNGGDWPGLRSGLQGEDPDGNMLSVLCTNGMDLFDDSDRPVLSLCHHGFAAPGVTHIEVHTPRDPLRRIAPTGEPRGFIAITTGLPVSLKPLGSEDAVLGPTWDFTG